MRVIIERDKYQVGFPDAVFLVDSDNPTRAIELPQIKAIACQCNERGMAITMEFTGGKLTLDPAEIEWPPD